MEGKTVILDEKAFTSPRKWHAQGVAYTTFKNWLITCLFILGFSPKALSKWYFINREPKQSKMKA